MRDMKLGVAVGLVAAALAAPLPAIAVGSPSGRAPVSALTRALTDGTGLDPAAAATLSSFRQSPHAAEFLAALEQAEDLGSAHFVYVEPVHDVTGDGSEDVLSVDNYIAFTMEPGVLFPSIEYEVRVILRALDGATGELLWTKRARYRNGYMEAIEARTGPGGDNGFALLVFDGALGTIQQREFTIRTLTGGGNRVWARTWEATVVDEFPAYSYVNVPVTLGVFDAVEGRSTDYLVGLGNIVVAGVAWVADVRAVSVEGAGGLENEHPAHEVGAGTVLPTPWAMGDLSGDGLDDYVFVNPTPQAAQGEESLEQGGVVRARLFILLLLVCESCCFFLSDYMALWWLG
ncbi:MAG: hypothetical protein M3273_01370, partial [Actinomycetota bacterium]|nr:hypothetical protein [Actinomycetota bacterium]